MRPQDCLCGVKAPRSDRPLRMIALSLAIVKAPTKAWRKDSFTFRPTLALTVNYFLKDVSLNEDNIRLSRSGMKIDHHASKIQSTRITHPGTLKRVVATGYATSPDEKNARRYIQQAMTNITKGSMEHPTVSQISKNTLQRFSVAIFCNESSRLQTAAQRSDFVAKKNFEWWGKPILRQWIDQRFRMKQWLLLQDVNHPWRTIWSDQRTIANLKNPL